MKIPGAPLLLLTLTIGCDRVVETKGSSECKNIPGRYRLHQDAYSVAAFDTCLGKLHMMVTTSDKSGWITVDPIHQTFDNRPLHTTASLPVVSRGHAHR